MKSRVFSWVIGSVLVLAALFLLMNTVNYKLNGTGWQVSNGYGYGYGGDNPPSPPKPCEKKCGALCCAQTDTCDASVPVCCPDGYIIKNKVCLAKCPKNQKSCNWGCCEKNQKCGTSGFCITDNQCPEGTSDCPADDHTDSSKDCCKTDGSETCMNTGGVWAVYFCSANSCNSTQEICKIELPPKAPKLPFPEGFAICCDKGTCSHFPAGQPYCKKSNSTTTTTPSVQNLISSTPVSQNSKPLTSETKVSLWKKILRTFKIE